MRRAAALPAPVFDDPAIAPTSSMRLVILLAAAIVAAAVQIALVLL